MLFYHRRFIPRSRFCGTEKYSGKRPDILSSTFEITLFSPNGVSTLFLTHHTGTGSFYLQLWIAPINHFAGPRSYNL